ncbi:zinc metalloprotease [Uliginosibacterium aquaticum]|uniref:Uncharacterized protein n=1 Tax=Uliginosibacterium aquaticum TaxID=2731212 RepID=A0ABX2IGA8_9RHOO|nr:hypothetical protein [Uliginosibacterium aquaticum]NSL55517.1 hypothetical protein [Uliginosibacterium aquaticum]
MWKKLRIAILLFILATVGLNAWRAHAQTRDWSKTLQVSIFPLNGDGSPAAAARIARLQEEDFKDIEAFFTEQAQAHGVSNPRPLRVSLQPALSALPPAAPMQRSGLDVLLWSLKLRYWAWQQPDGVPRAHVRAFVIFWDSDANGGRVPDSHGLAKGQIAISNVHSTRAMQHSNNVVIAHEILHTMGATDKYGPDLRPQYPAGFAEPDANPRYPQRLCEIMAGRTPVSETELEIPRSLAECLIGPLTAQEVGMRH